MSRRAAKVDANQTAIVDALRAVGCSVQSLAEVGAGCPDLLVGIANTNILLEIKDGSRSPSERRFTPAQKRWHTMWNGNAHLVETVEQALAVVGLYRGRTLRCPHGVAAGNRCLRCD